MCCQLHSGMSDVLWCTPDSDLTSQKRSGGRMISSCLSLPLFLDLRPVNNDPQFHFRSFNTKRGGATQCGILTGLVVLEGSNSWPVSSNQNNGGDFWNDCNWVRNNALLKPGRTHTDVFGMSWRGLYRLVHYIKLSWTYHGECWPQSKLKVV